MSESFDFYRALEGGVLVVRKMGLVGRQFYLKPVENAFSILRIRTCLGLVQAYTK